MTSVSLKEREDLYTGHLAYWKQIGNVFSVHYITGTRKPSDVPFAELTIREISGDSFSICSELNTQYVTAAS